MKTSTTPKREILTIVSVNIWRGLDVKVKQLSELVEKHKVDILMLQETDIKGRQRAEKFQMKNFVTILPLVKEKQKVRVMTLVRDSLSKHVKVREDLMSQKITSIWIEVKKQKSKGALIGNFYREWKGEDQEDLLVQCQKDRLQMFGQQVQKAVMSKSECHPSWWGFQY